MSLFKFNFPTNFRTELSKIDALEVSDIDDVREIKLGQFVLATETVFEGFGDDPELTLTVLNSNLTGVTTFTVSDDGQLIYQYVMTSPLYIYGGYDLKDAIAGIEGTNPDYISFDVGNVISAFGSDDEMIGEGRFFGRGGNDKIELEDQVGTLGSATEESLADGGTGNDILKAAVLNSVMRGGWGNDTLVLEFGNSSMFGGDGGDQFIIDNGFWDADGTPDQADQKARAVVHGFGTGNDVLVFASVDSDMAFGDPVVRESLEDLFGAGDLGDLANFTQDGVTLKFRENDAGNAVILRQGTDSEGRTYDERVVIKGKSLDEIDRSDVFLQDYASDTYEFF